VTGFDGLGNFNISREVGTSSNIELLSDGYGGKFGRINLGGNSNYASAYWSFVTGNVLGQSNKAIIDFNVRNPASDKQKKFAIQGTGLSETAILFFNSDGTIQDKAGNKSAFPINTWKNFRIIVDPATDTYTTYQLKGGEYIKIFNSQSIGADLSILQQIKFTISSTMDTHIYSLDFDDIKIFQAINVGVITSPSLNQTGVSTKLSSLTLSFDKVMSLGSLNSQNIQLLTDGGVVVPTTIISTTSNSVVIGGLLNDLDYSSIYKISYSNLIAADGSPCTNGVVPFTTEDVNNPPKVISSYPANAAVEVPVSPNAISITFSYPIDQTTLNSSNIIVQKYVSGAFIDVSYSGIYNTTSNTYNMTLSGMKLDAATEYIVKLSENIKDTQARLMGSNTIISFSTATAAFNDNFNDIPDSMSFAGRPGIYIEGGNNVTAIRLTPDNIAVKLERITLINTLIQKYSNSNSIIPLANGMIIAETKFKIPTGSNSFNRSILIGGTGGESYLALFNPSTRQIKVSTYTSNTGTFVNDQWFGMRWVVNSVADTFTAYYSSDLINYTKIGTSYPLGKNLSDIYLLKTWLSDSVNSISYIDDMKMSIAMPTHINSITSGTKQINGGTNIPITANSYKINFAGNMDTTTMTNNNIKLYKVSDNSQITTSVTGNLSTECTISVNALDYDTKYKLVVSNLKNQYGVTSPTKEYYFTTIPSTSGGGSGTVTNPLLIDYVNYTDSNGVALQNLNVGTVNINVGISNIKGAPINALLLACVYKDGLCVRVSGVEESIPRAGSAVVNTSIDMPADRTNCTLKLLLWDGESANRTLNETRIFVAQ
jgi:hypothetical protein